MVVALGVGEGEGLGVGVGEVAAAVVPVVEAVEVPGGWVFNGTRISSGGGVGMCSETAVC